MVLPSQPPPSLVPAPPHTNLLPPLQHGQYVELQRGVVLDEVRAPDNIKQMLEVCAALPSEAQVRQSM